MSDKISMRHNLSHNLRTSQWHFVYALIIIGFVGVLFLGVSDPIHAQQNPSGQIITNTSTLAAGEIIRVPGGEIRHLALSPDGNRVAVATSAGLWLYKPGAANKGQLMTTTAITAAWWSPSGNLLAATTYTGTLQIWQTAAAISKAVTIQSKTSKIVTAAWSPDGSQIATGAADGAVALWQAANGNLQETRNWHTGAVNSLLWSADGTTLLSGAKDGSLRLWIIKTLASTGTISPSNPVSQTGNISQTKSISPTSNAAPTATGAAAQAIIQADSLNIRSGPGTTYAKIGSAKLNERLTVLGQVNACVWLQVKTPNGGQGWIAGSAQFVTLTTACELISPAINPAATNQGTTAAPAAQPLPPSLASSTTPSTTLSQDNLPATQGCYLFQNQLGAELNVTVTRTDTNKSKTFKVPSGQETLYCTELGHYKYTIDAPPPWASINGDLEVKAGDRFLFPIRAQ